MTAVSCQLSIFRCLHKSYIYDLFRAGWHQFILFDNSLFLFAVAICQTKHYTCGIQYENNFYTVCSFTNTLQKIAYYLEELKLRFINCGNKIK